MICVCGWDYDMDVEVLGVKTFRTGNLDTGLFKHNMEQSKIWEDLKRCLPYRNNPEQNARRKEIWNSIDVNNNGYLSLAEIDKGLRDIVCLPILFDTKPVIMRAFQASKNKVKATNTHGPDYVSRAEFRYLLSYLRQYYEYWVAFSRLDKNFDRRVSLAELAGAGPVLQRWGIKMASPEQTLKEMDTDKKGMVLFDEFCAWAIKKNLDIEDDDDEKLDV